MTQPYPDLSALLARGGDVALIHVDLSDPIDQPASEMDLRRRAVAETLQKAGASGDDVAALLGAFTQRPEVDGPVGLVALARDGEFVLQQLAPGQPPVRDTASVGPVPDLTAVVRAREAAVPYVLVEADAEGGVLRFVEAAGLADHDDVTVSGSTENIHKTHGGGNAQAKREHTVENRWRANAGEVAKAATDEAERMGAQLIVVTGDPQVAQLVVSAIPDSPSIRVAQLGRDTVAAGADEQDAAAVADYDSSAIVDLERSTALDALQAGAGTAGALGVEAVVAALQQGRVDTLLLDDGRFGEPDPDDDGSDGSPTLLALAAAPWIALGDDDALSVEVVGAVPVGAALVRAAILTDAVVRFPAAGRLPESQVVAATLRWADADADADATAGTDDVEAEADLADENAPGGSALK